MAKYLQQLLQASDPLFTIGMKKLELATGGRGIDVGLIGDIHERAYGVMRDLGLDPKNTTTKELWLALHGKYPKGTLKNTAYVGLVTVDGVISFNENDVKHNKNHSFADRTADAMKQSLAGEIAKRYLATGRETYTHIEALMSESGIRTFNLQHNQEDK